MSAYIGVQRIMRSTFDGAGVRPKAVGRIWLSGKNTPVRLLDHVVNVGGIPWRRTDRQPVVEKRRTRRLEGLREMGPLP